MNYNKILPIRLRKRRPISQMPEEIPTVTSTVNDIAGVSRAAGAFKQIPFNVKHTMIRSYHPRKQDPSTSTGSSLNTSTNNTPHSYQVVRCQILKNERKDDDPLIGNLPMQEIQRSNMRIFNEFGDESAEIPVYTLSDTGFDNIADGLRETALGNEAVAAIKVEDAATDSDLKPDNKIDDFSSGNKMNELLSKLDTFLQNRERDESNDHEYAFGRAVALLLKHIKDVNKILKIETKIFGIICEELESMV